MGKIKKFLFEKKMKAKGMSQVNANNLHDHVNFMDFDSCKKFLCNLHVGESRIEQITLENGQQVKMEDIPDDQVIQRAQELRKWIMGN